MYNLDLSACTTTAGSTTVVDSTVTILAEKAGKKIENKTTYLQMTGGAASSTENERYGLLLTLTGTAKITAQATTKTDGKTLRLINTSTSTSTDATTTMSSSGTASTDANDAVEISFENVTEGTYIFGSSSGGCNLFSLKIEYQ